MIMTITRDFEMVKKKKKRYIPVRPRENLVMTAPVMPKPTRKGQLRFHSRLKKIGHGSNFGISLFSFAFFFLSLTLSLSLEWVATTYL